MWDMMGATNSTAWKNDALLILNTKVAQLAIVNLETEYFMHFAIVPTPMQTAVEEFPVQYNTQKEAYGRHTYANILSQEGVEKSVDFKGAFYSFKWLMHWLQQDLYVYHLII